ncbi:hypothetical protein SKAU_G00411740 [Synaphobranchus kaupii]|uniref:Uncharacterized protein n=1 Tax=Synaphobranchus kaupii TaxID=118154 RepID=A0A9Q1IB06_SYNKA|nr:hypothetical protein SKAU_G00411740 [Synaphobranchus kaupii]
MGPCIVMLKNEVMALDEWHDNGPQHLITVSLCIQIAMDTMHLSSLPVEYACPYQHPTTTGHFVHNVNISKPLTHATPYTLPAICPVQLKLRFISEEDHSPACQWPLKTIPQVKNSDVAVLGWSAVVRPVGRTSKIPEVMLEKLTFITLATAVQDIPAVSMPIAQSLKS